jgi:cytochrome c553
VDLRVWLAAVAHVLAAEVPLLADTDTAETSERRSQPLAPTAEPGTTLEMREALALTGDAERGRLAFEACAVCHDADGSGRADGTFPRISGQHPTVIIKQLVDIRDGRRENHLMLVYAQRLIGPQEIADIARYASGLPPPERNGQGDGRDLARAAEDFRSDCAACHGARAQGDAEHFVPKLAGQHYGYLLRQIRDIGARRRGNAHPDMVALTAHYRDAELRALVDYVSRIDASSSGEAGQESGP